MYVIQNYTEPVRQTKKMLNRS